MRKHRVTIKPVVTGANNPGLVQSAEALKQAGIINPYDLKNNFLPDNRDPDPTMNALFGIAWDAPKREKRRAGK